MTDDFVKFSWNVWPSSRLNAARLVVPIGCVISPLRPITGPVIPNDPVLCKQEQCKAVLNSLCQVHFQSKVWVCPFCLQRNPFPPIYSGISETNCPWELNPAVSTVEYRMSRPVAGPPIFLFVVDTYMAPKDLQVVKETLISSLSMMPPQTLVGLITFGRVVQVYELGFTECTKTYCFQAKEYTTQQVQDLLGMQGARSGGTHRGPVSGASRFVLPVSECDFSLTSILEELQKEAFEIPAQERPRRCTGAALAVAVALMESAASVGRVLLYCGGPCVAGPGQVVAPERSQFMRSHIELSQGRNIPFLRKATQYYEALAKRMVTAGVVCDFFAASLDQLGYLEMKSLVEHTGGLTVQTDNFECEYLKRSLRKLFDPTNRGPSSDPVMHGYVDFGYNATLEVQTSGEFKVCGIVGPCMSLAKKNRCVADTEVGQGGTYMWSLGGVDPSTTLAIYLEVVNQANAPVPQNQFPCLQIMMSYRHPNGEQRLRVTTVRREWTADPESPQVPLGFDQEIAAMLIARMAVLRAETEDAYDILKWVDRQLIRLSSKFGKYTPNQPDTFHLQANFAIYPQLMFHLRRSPFLQVFNNSPDETAYHRTLLMRENANNSLVMIQPTLIKYTFQGSEPTLLDAKSIQPDAVLLLDSFFEVVVFHGETIKLWCDEGYQNQPEHQNFRDLLSLPVTEAQEILKERFPSARYIECVQGDSQSRVVMCKVNPSITHRTHTPGQGNLVITDDVSFQVFMNCLMKFATGES